MTNNSHIINNSLLCTLMINSIAFSSLVANHTMLSVIARCVSCLNIIRHAAHFDTSCRKQCFYVGSVIQFIKHCTTGFLEKYFHQKICLGPSVDRSNSQGINHCCICCIFYLNVCYIELDNCWMLV